MTTELDIPQTVNVGMLSNNDILFGETISPIDKLKTFSAEAFENFTREWVVGFLIKKGDYIDCKKCSGAGDMGRDVIAKIDKKKWDNYQCKHYKDPLTPGDAFKEIIKLIHYTKIKEYTLPEKYVFVSPCGAGPTLNRYIENPIVLKKELYKAWDANKKIGKISVDLTDELKEYIDEKINFEIFDAIDGQVLIEQHKETAYYAARFGGGLNKRRDANKEVPTDIQANEQVYTTELFKAYSEYKKEEFKENSHLEKDQILADHFQRQRVGFYSADALNQYSRDRLPPGCDYFEDLKNQFFHALADIVDDDHNSGFEKVKATILTSHRLNIDSNPLVSKMRIEDRTGICHHLVNDLKFKWVK